MTLHGLSFDIEDWHQLLSLRVDGMPGNASNSVDGCVDRILDFCDEQQIKATFFVVGFLAEQRPHLVTAIAARGHEIASHSLRHRLVHSMTIAEFEEDLRASKHLLEEIAGIEVVGFRAPEFSVQRLGHPCFAALAKAGFRYDSSVFPVEGMRYGISGAPHAPFTMETEEGALVELPLASRRVGRWRLPIAGGSHFRILPTSLVERAIRVPDEMAESMVFYLHPYEFARELLFLPGGLRRNRSIVKHIALHNFGIKRVERTLRMLCSRLKFVPLRDLATATRNAHV